MVKCSYKIFIIKCFVIVQRSVDGFKLSDRKINPLNLTDESNKEQLA